jgi:hypothetical protein
VTKLAPQVRAPTLVLHATGDAVAPFNEGRKVASLIPGARFVPLEGKNHILLETEPAWTRFVDEVRRFLRSGPDVAESPPPAPNAAVTRESTSPQRSARRPRGRSR